MRLTHKGNGGAPGRLCQAHHPWLSGGKVWTHPVALEELSQGGQAGLWVAGS